MRTPDFNHELALARIVYLSADSGFTILVMENQTYRFLLIDGSIQSVLKLDDPQAIVFPHQQILLAGLEHLSTDARVLELGLGGGSALRHASYCYPSLIWTCIEQSAEVVNLYWDYFAPDQPLSRHEIVLGDSLSWLQDTSASRQFELILCDVYDEVEESLIEACLARLTPTGVLMVNWLPNLQPQADKSMAVLGSLIQQHGLLHERSEVTGFRNQIHRLAKSKEIYVGLG